MENELKENQWDKDEGSDYEDWNGGVKRPITPSSPSYHCDGCGHGLSLLIPSRKCEKGCVICCMCDEETWHHDDNGRRLRNKMMIYIDENILILEKDCPGCKWKIIQKERDIREKKKRKYLETLKNELNDIIEKTPKLSRYIELIKTDEFTEEEINSIEI
jgi:hypothetical protein